MQCRGEPAHRRWVWVLPQGMGGHSDGTPRTRWRACGPTGGLDVGGRGARRKHGAPGLSGSDVTPVGGRATGAAL